MGRSDASAQRNVNAQRSDASARRSVKAQRSDGVDSRQVRAKAGGADTRVRSVSFLEFLSGNYRYILMVVGVVLVVTVGIFAARALMPPVQVDEGKADDGVYVSPYDWDNLDRANGRYRYIVNGETKSRLGIDVSESQHEIDWQQVSADGIDFAIVRVGYRGATEGNLYLDDFFRANLDGAQAAGLDCGVYFFSQANTVDEAVEEADFVLEQLNGMKLAYPVAFDSEVVNLKGEEAPTRNLTQEEMTAIADAFCDRIEAAGYQTLIYGNIADLARYQHDSLGHRPIWWAEYGTSAPHENLAISLWQYSNSGKVAGVSTNVDMNIDLRG